MTIGELCAGYGGLGLGIQAVAGGEIAWVADNDPGAATILAHRFPGIPNWGDITTIDWNPHVHEPVDILAAGFPCQDVSCAGQRAGLRAGTRSGVWSHVARAIGELQPSLVVLENVKGLLSASADSNVEPCPWCVGEAGNEHPLRAAGAVFGDLALLGFDAQWVTVPASGVGAPHRRERVFVLAWPANTRHPDQGQAHPSRRTADRWTAPGWGDGEPGTGDQRPAADTPGGGRPSFAPGGVPGTGAAAPGRGTPAHRPGDGPAAADPGDGPVTERPRDQGWPGGERPPVRGVAGERGPVAEDTDRAARGQRRQPAPGQEEGGRPRPDAGRPDREGTLRLQQWGPYAPAIAQWATVLGREAPAPTEPGRDGRPRLSPRFVEWMMGLPDFWVTGVPGLSRTQQLKALGNGVVPQQAAYALSILLATSPVSSRG